MERANEPVHGTPEDMVAIEVVLVLLLIPAVMLLVHFMQPEGTVTESSSAAPTYESR